MHIRSVLLARYFALIFLSLLLAACDTSTTGTPPASSTPSRGDGSVVAQSTLTTTPTQVRGLTPTAGTGSQNTPTPSASLGNAYAFGRAAQLWVAINGASPVQATHFDYSSAGPTPNIFFGQPLWFASDRFVAFTLKALGGGLGGGRLWF